MMNELVALSLFVFLLSTVESQKPIKKVLSIVKDIKKNMLTLDEMEEIKEQIVDEAINSIVPVIKESCSCCDDEPPQDCVEQGNSVATKLRRFLSKDPSSSSSSVHFQMPKNLRSFEDFRLKIAKIFWENLPIFWTKLSEKV